MQTEIECIVCPTGCRLVIEHQEQEVDAVHNAGCEKGYEYAEQEIKNPVRVLTTTVRVIAGELPLVSVRSAQPLPRALIAPGVARLRGYSFRAPVSTGDVLIEDFMGTGTAIKATGQVKKAEVHPNHAASR